MTDRQANHNGLETVPPVQDWREWGRRRYPRLPDKVAQPDALAFVEQFFHGDDWEERAKHLHRLEFEDAIDTYVCNTPLDEIELFRFASCWEFGESAAFSRLLCLSLDNWIQTLAGTPLPHPDITKYIEAVAMRMEKRDKRRGVAMPFGAINAYPNYIGGSEHITELRAYLNTTCHHKGIGELWISTFHTFFREKRPEFELIFLYQMLHRRTYRRWNLDVDARRCLCLCGYEYIKRLPPEEFDWNEPTIETMISRTVIRTAIEDSIFTLPEQDAPFREALMVYLFVEDINNLSLMLYTNPDYWMQSIAQDPARDAAFRDVLADCMRRILVDKESPFPAKRMDHMRNKIGSLSIFLSEEQKRYGWTANSKETIEKNLKCQVDGIVTDDPELVMHYAMQTWHRRLLSLFVRNFFAP